MITMKIFKFLKAKKEDLKSFLQFMKFEFTLYKENFLIKNV